MTTTTPTCVHQDIIMSEPAAENDLTQNVHDTVKSQLETSNDNVSDYGDFGSDVEELEIIDQLLSQVASKHDQDAPLLVTDIEDYEPPRGIRLPKRFGSEKSRQQDIPTSSQYQLQILRDLEASSAQAGKRNGQDTATGRSPFPKSPPQDNETQTLEPDTRSPLERFRRPPKKALSVTDLVSPAWCELQYAYTLSKHGRKRRTPAMKQGSAVHQQLEDEVHITVPVEITTKEDSWGLRIWNIIQGLRTLRDTGRTRELEVWGSIGGEIVNGVIDELSYECPDPSLEQKVSGNQTKKNESPVLPEYQTSITDFMQPGLAHQQGQSMKQALSDDIEQPQSIPSQLDKRIYITDVKTRKFASLPTGSSIRPTILQLHLYHHMLENLALGNFSLVRLTERYDLDSNATFSDSFIAQIGNLNQDVFGSAPAPENDTEATQLLSSTQDSMDILLQHNNLSTLWDYMMSELRTTFILKSTSTTIEDTTPTPTPQSVSELRPPASQPTRLSPLLTAEYISTTHRHGPATKPNLLGRKTFVFNSTFLKSYLEDSLAWWRGEREARGVELQDAWKCRSCDFRDDCEWIHERDKAALEEVLERKKMREIAGVEGNQTRSKV